jgi:hypothetical protein
VKPVVFQRNYQKKLGIYIQNTYPIKSLSNRLDYNQLAFGIAAQTSSNYDLVTLLIGATTNIKKAFSLYEKNSLNLLIKAIACKR